MAEFADVSVADPVEVRKLYEKLLDTFQKHLESQDVKYLDSLMAIHNFYVHVILFIEQQTDTAESQFVRRTALATLMESLTNRKPLSGE